MDHPPNPGERTRAYRLRAKLRKGEELDPADLLWLTEYDARQAGTRGASASERIINIEERAMSVGTGAAAEAAAAAAVAREEGRRIDYLTKSGMEALVHACDMHRRMAEAMLRRTEVLEEVHLAMLDSVREQYLARTQAEVNAIGAEESGEGDIKAMLTSLLAQRLGAAPKPHSGRFRRKTSS